MEQRKNNERNIINKENKGGTHMGTMIYTSTSGTYEMPYEYANALYKLFRELEVEPERIAAHFKPKAQMESNNNE